jgi:hypothetical protein
MVRIKKTSPKYVNYERKGVVMIPCIKTKCLKYPACKHKTKVICDLIFEYYNKLESNLFSKIIAALIDCSIRDLNNIFLKDAQAHESKVWKKINQALPNLKKISTRQIKHYQISKQYLHIKQKVYIISVKKRRDIE